MYEFYFRSILEFCLIFILPWKTSSPSALETSPCSVHLTHLILCLMWRHEKSNSGHQTIFPSFTNLFQAFLAGSWTTDPHPHHLNKKPCYWNLQWPIVIDQDSENSYFHIWHIFIQILSPFFTLQKTEIDFASQSYCILWKL